MPSDLPIHNLLRRSSVDLGAGNPEGCAPAGRVVVISGCGTDAGASIAGRLERTTDR